MGRVAGSETQDLLAAVARGDSTSLNDLVARQLPLLRAWTRLRMGPVLAARETPTDIVQSACREVIQDLSHHSFRSEGHFRRGLFQAAERKLADRARFHGAEKRDAGRDVSPGSGGFDEALLGAYASIVTPSAMAMAHELAGQLERGFAQLPSDEREVIVMAKIEGLSSAEIAEEMGKSEGAVRTSLYRALGHLSALMVREAAQE